MLIFYRLLTFAELFCNASPSPFCSTLSAEPVKQKGEGEILRKATQLLDLFRIILYNIYHYFLEEYYNDKQRTTEDFILRRVY